MGESVWFGAYPGARRRGESDGGARDYGVPDEPGAGSEERRVEDPLHCERGTHRRSTVDDYTEMDFSVRSEVGGAIQRHGGPRAARADILPDQIEVAARRLPVNLDDQDVLGWRKLEANRRQRLDWKECREHNRANDCPRVHLAPP